MLMTFQNEEQHVCICELELYVEMWVFWKVSPYPILYLQLGLFVHFLHEFSVVLRELVYSSADVFLKPRLI